MSVATVADIIVQQAAGFECVFIYCTQLANSDPPAPDPTKPVNVTGWTARLQIRASIDGPVLAEAVSGGRGITVGTTDGQFIVMLSADQTAALTRGGIYDLLAQNPSPGAQPERVAEGAVTVERAVTLVV